MPAAAAREARQVRLQGPGNTGARLGLFLLVLVLIVIALGYWILVVNRPAV